MVQSGNIVRKATSDDAEPTPGYLFIEMASVFFSHTTQKQTLKPPYLFTTHLVPLSFPPTLPQTLVTRATRCARGC